MTNSCLKVLRADEGDRDRFFQRFTIGIQGNSRTNRNRCRIKLNRLSFPKLRDDRAAKSKTRLQFEIC